MSGKKIDEFSENLSAKKTSIMNIARALCRLNTEDLEDAFQRASVKMLNKFDSYNRVADFSSWAAGFVVNEAKNIGRANMRRLKIVEVDSTVFDRYEEKVHGVADGDIVSIENMLRAIESLPSKEKKLIKAVYVDGARIDELAKKNKRSPRTYYNLLTIIKKKIVEKCKS